MLWFRNLKCGEKFDRGAEKRTHANPTDFSLQLAVALQQFAEWRNLGHKMMASRYREKAAQPGPGQNNRSTTDEPIVASSYTVEMQDEDRTREYKVLRGRPIRD